MIGLINLINSLALNSGNLTTALNIAQELRGRINRWRYTGRLWKWLTEPINQILAHVDTTNLWRSCQDLGQWVAFRAVAIYPWVWPIGDVLRIGAFFLNPLVSNRRNPPPSPAPGREILCFSADATPVCIGWTNCPTDEFFYRSPSGIYFS